jgi:hyperosmotically inducible protein
MKIKHYVSLLAIAGVLSVSPYLFAQYTQTQTNATAPDQQAMANDSQINAAVKDKLTKDPSLSNVTLNAATSQGVVSLSGSVSTVEQLSTATVIAQSVPGVKNVDTASVTITDGGGMAQQSIADALITAKVKGMYIQKKLFGDSDVPIMSINVDTSNGVVTLRGSVENQDQIDNAINIAKSINGVTAVKSSLVIK